MGTAGLHLARDTLTARGAEYAEPRTGAVSVPIFQSATFRHPALGQSTGFDYSRGANPTRKALEDTLALLEGGAYGLAFASGLGAISTLLKIFRPGAHIVVSEDLYGGTYRMFNTYYAQYGFTFSYVDTSNSAEVEAACTAQTKALFIETPSNPMMRVSDIHECAKIIHARGGLLVTDNTFCTPYFQNPLALGSDVVIHSGTKYLAGHNDTLSGFLVHSLDNFEPELRAAQMGEGATLSPFDSWLTLRGIKTLALRMEKHAANARVVAHWLRAHPKVKKVFYTGFDDHPQYAVSRKQARGDSGMVSFYVHDIAMVHQILQRVRLVLFAESLGGVESLITYPWQQTHSSIPEEMRRKTGVTECLMRISVGIENPNDIIADMEQALA